MSFILTAAIRETHTYFFFPLPTVLKAFVVIKLLLSRGLPVSKFTLKYFNKMISNVYSLNKYSPAAILGQVLCWRQDNEVTSRVPPRLPGTPGRRQMHPKSEHWAWSPGAVQAVFVQEMNE